MDTSFKYFLLSTLLLPLILLTVSCEKTEPVDLSFFYMEVCPGCESYQKAETLSGFVFSLGKTKKYKAEVWNLGHGDQEGNIRLLDLIEKYDHPDISYSLPLLFAGDEYYVGYEDIESKLRTLLDSI